MQAFAEIFKALSNPHRLRLFLRLVSCCEPGTVCETDAGTMPVCVGEVGKEIGIAPSTLSHHLKALRQAGLILMERRGQKVACWVDPNIIKELAGFFTDHAGQAYPEIVAMSPDDQSR